MQAGARFNEHCTIVTALFDLGRGRWPPPYDRAFDEYLSNVTTTLSLRCPMVIHIAEDTFDHIVRFRRLVDPGLDYTEIVVGDLTDMPAYPRLHAIEAVLASPAYQAGVRDTAYLDTSVFGQRPDTYVPLYTMLLLSKTGLVDDACERDPFGTRYLMWCDAGLCRERFPPELLNACYPSDSGLDALADGRVHITCRSLPTDADRDLDRFFHSGVCRFAGGWWAGTQPSLRAFHRLSEAQVDRCLAAGTIDGEQAVYARCYLEQPSLFTLEYGDWYDGFRMFGGLEREAPGAVPPPGLVPGVVERPPLVPPITDR